MRLRFDDHQCTRCSFRIGLGAGGSLTSGGQGTVNVSNGGSLMVGTTVSIGAGTNSIAAVNITGPHSSLLSNGSVYVGGSETTSNGAGTLFIAQGAHLKTLGTLIIYPGGVVNLNGGSLEATAISGIGAFNWNTGFVNVMGSGTIAARRVRAHRSAPFRTPSACRPGYGLAMASTTINPGYTLQISGGSFTSGGIT